MAGLPLEVGVTQRHADVVQEAGQRAQFDDGVLESEGTNAKSIFNGPLIELIMYAVFYHRINFEWKAGQRI